MKNQKGFTVVEMLVCIWFLLCVSVVVGVLYAAFHFISKFW